ncbi:MAG: DUF2059 domain-containing protein [Flammeovirgaceae bacterium]
MRTIVVILVSVLLSYSSVAQTDSYQATLKKYLEVSGSVGAFKSAITTMIGSFKTIKSSVPDQFWKEMEAELSKTSIDDLVAHLVPAYQKHLSEAELNEIIKFYGSPIGKKLAEKTPAIASDSMQAGQIWGQKIGAKLMEKLKEKGY